MWALCAGVKPSGVSGCITPRPPGVISAAPHLPREGDARIQATKPRPNEIGYLEFGKSGSQVTRDDQCLILDRGHRQRRSGRWQRGVVVLSQGDQIRESHSAVAVEVALRPIFARQIVILGQGDQVSEVNRAVVVGVPSKVEEVDVEIAAWRTVSIPIQFPIRAVSDPVRMRTRSRSSTRSLRRRPRARRPRTRRSSRPSGRRWRRWLARTSD
jgi:hypothetical protein